MFEPTKASVRPRVLAGSGRGTVLLEDLVAELADSGENQWIELSGFPGSGTTTALRHISLLFGESFQLSLAKLRRPMNSVNAQPTGMIGIRPTKSGERTLLKCTLATWGRDEWIEYLLAVHKHRCACVMKRLQNDPNVHRLDGNPNILHLTLDELAGDDALPDVKSAMNIILDNRFPGARQRDATSRRIFKMMFRREGENHCMDKIISQDLSEDQIRLLWIPIVRLMLATDAACHELRDASSGDRIQIDWARELIIETVPKITGSPSVQDRLRRWIQRNDPGHSSLAISLLHLANAPWEWPSSKLFGGLKKPLDLSGVILDGADCTRFPLARCNLVGASLERVRLSSVNLRHVNATSANFAEANLSQAILADFTGINSIFRGADLTSVVGQRADFSNADLSLTSFKDAQFDHCSFLGANLCGADMTRATLKNCSFMESHLVDADFRHATLESANFSNSNLTVADFRYASFRRARLRGCHMVEMELCNADFEFACLEDAVMTGSILPHANLAKANLRFAKLADVDWESVDLRYADLEGATFHMGSSRSGLVPSSIPLEGSSTGFYSDDWNEQDFKSPEEIRKANLRGADLRGAIIDGVDFYLVDLRDAIYDADQAKQLRRTGAILETRIC